MGRGKVDQGRRDWVMAATLLGWLLLVSIVTFGLWAELGPAMQSFVAGTELRLDPRFDALVALWMVGSILCHGAWWACWGNDEYRRFVLHGAFLSLGEEQEDMSGSLANIGLLAGYIVGLLLAA